jgi:hypothetical protein
VIDLSRRSDSLPALWSWSGKDALPATTHWQNRCFYVFELGSPAMMRSSVSGASRRLYAPRRGIFGSVNRTSGNDSRTELNCGGITVTGYLAEMAHARSDLRCGF